MIDLKKAQNGINKIKKMQETIVKEKENLELKRADYEKRKKEFEESAKEEKNPFRQVENNDIAKKFNDESEKIEEIETSIKEKEELLKEFYNQFILDMKAKVAIEKTAIEAKAKEYEDLKEKRDKLKEMKKLYESQIKEWTKKEISPDDDKYSVYVSLREEDIPKLKKEIIQVNSEIRKIRPKKLMADWDKLEAINLILENQHIKEDNEYKEYKLRELEGKIQEIREENAKKRRISKPSGNVTEKGKKKEDKTEEKSVIQIKGSRESIAVARALCDKAIDAKDAIRLKDSIEALEKAIKTSKITLDTINKMPAAEPKDKEDFMRIIEVNDNKVQELKEILKELEISKADNGKDNNINKNKDTSVEPKNPEDIKSSKKYNVRPDTEKDENGRENEYYTENKELTRYFESTIGSVISKCMKAVKNNDKKELENQKVILDKTIKSAKNSLEACKKIGIPIKEENKFTEFIAQSEKALQTAKEQLKIMQEQEKVNQMKKKQTIYSGTETSSSKKSSPFLEYEEEDIIGKILRENSSTPQKLTWAYKIKKFINKTRKNIIDKFKSTKQKFLTRKEHDIVDASYVSVTKNKRNNMMNSLRKSNEQEPIIIDIELGRNKQSGRKTAETKSRRGERGE